MENRFFNIENRFFEHVCEHPGLSYLARPSQPVTGLAHADVQTQLPVIETYRQKKTVLE
jgi:hypothetical protein